MKRGREISVCTRKKPEAKRDHAQLIFHSRVCTLLAQPRKKKPREKPPEICSMLNFPQPNSSTPGYIELRAGFTTREITYLASRTTSAMRRNI